jgi:hypothetical protein
MATAEKSIADVIYNYNYNYPEISASTTKGDAVAPN